MLWSTPESKLMKAVRRNRHEELRALLRDVDPNLRKGGKTPLLLAAECGNSKTVDILLQNGASTISLDQKGRTPLIKAVQCHNQNAVAVLGVADSNSLDNRDYFGFSASNYALKYSYQSILKELRDLGSTNRIPLHALTEDGSVNAMAQGHNIEKIEALVRNDGNRFLKIVILPGTVWKSNDQVQDMMVISEQTGQLRVGDAAPVDLQVACMNADQDIPNSANTFTRVGFANPKVIQLVRHLEGAKFPTMQAALWITYNHLPPFAIKDKLKDGDGNPVIKDADITRAVDAINFLKGR